MKPILDACCGSRMFWFDKNNPNVEFCDIREVPYHEYYKNRYYDTLQDKGVKRNNTAKTQVREI